MAARMIFVKHQSDHVTQCLSSALGINSKLLTMAYRALSNPAPASPFAVMYLPPHWSFTSATEVFCVFHKFFPTSKPSHVLFSLLRILFSWPFAALGLINLFNSA